MGRPGLGNHPGFTGQCDCWTRRAPTFVATSELIWEVAYECGNPIIGDATDIELAADWHGEPEKLCQAL